MSRFSQSPFAEPTPPDEHPRVGSDPSVPPPPPSSIEVSIRTRESDSAERARPGRIVAPASPEAPPMPVPAPPADGNSSFWVWAVVAASGVAVLFLIGYFLLPMFFPKRASPPPSSSARPPALPAASPAADFFAHRSYFQSPADATVTAYVAKEDLWAEVRRSLAEANSSASVIERSEEH